MSGFTFGIGNDDTKDNLLEDNDFFEEDSIKAGEVPEFNEDTTIINENTSTLEENGLLTREQGELREIRHKPAGSNVNLENLISKIKKQNKVNQSIALEAYDLGFRDELPRVYTYTTQLSDKHLETTLEALERGLVTGVSTEDLDGSAFRDLFGEVYNQVNGLVKGKGSDYSFENKKTEKNRYFHISFDSTLEGIWNPKRPDGYLEDNDSDDSSDKTWPYPEPSLPRISVSTSLEGCFRGVYPNVYRYFEVEKYPYMLFNIYEAVLDGKEKLLTTSDLTNKRMVWDAHVTEECCFLSPVKMKLVGELKVFNTNKSKTLMIHPFDDKKLPKESAGPIDIKYSIKWTEEEKEDEEEVSNENPSVSNESLVMAGAGLFGLFLAGSWAYNKSTEIWNQLFGQGPRNPESKEVVEEIQKGFRVVGVKSAPKRGIRLILSDTYDVSKTYVFPFKYIPGLEDGLSPIHNYHEILTRFDAMYKDYITLSHDYRKSIHDYDRYIKNVETDGDYHKERDSEEDLADFIFDDLERPEFNKDPYALDSHLTYLGNHANIDQKKFKLAWPSEQEVTNFKTLRETLRKKYLGNLKKERNIGYDVTGKGDFVKFIEKYNLAKYGDGDELFGTDWIIGCFSLASMNNLLIQLLEDKHVDELFAKVGIR